MNLPIISQLKETQSTYITFSKALLDFDKSIANGSPCYFTKMVALNLPVWENPNFFINLSALGINTNNPNIVVPKMIQYYMENIIRQTIGVNDVDVPEIAEIAFWKTLNKMGLSTVQSKATVTFINQIVTSNFVTSENNNGWGEIVCVIPNKCKSLETVWKSLTTVTNVVQGVNSDVCLFDNGDLQFEFIGKKDVLDFDNCVFDEVEEKTFDFNTLLLFYTDESGVNKLHGINFIYPFENKVTYWNQQTFTQKTNIAQTIGYQFLFNMKTCNNQATQIAIQSLNDHTHWNTFSQTLGLLNSFLENKMREAQPQSLIS